MGRHNFSEIELIYLQYKTLLIKLKLNEFKATSRGVMTDSSSSGLLKIMRGIVKSTYL